MIGRLRARTQFAAPARGRPVIIPRDLFVRIAEGYGVGATSVSLPGEFVLALKDALDSRAPAVIEVCTA